MEKLRIIPTTQQDVSLILQFIRELAEYEKLGDRVEATEQRLLQSLFGPTPYASCVIAYLGVRPVAFALYYFSFSTFAGSPGLYLEDLFVKPDVRSQGIGKALLRHLAQLATEKGCWRIEWAVLHWNKDAIAFYEKLGATPMDGWAVYRLWGDALSRLAEETTPE